jgi:hypothetical protein
MDRDYTLTGGHEICAPRWKLFLKGVWWEEKDLAVVWHAFREIAVDRGYHLQIEDERRGQ